MHYFKYVVGEQNLTLPFLGSKVYSMEVLVSAFNTVGQISSLLGVLIVSWLAKKLGKKTTFMIFFVIAIVSTASFYVLTANQIALIYIMQVFGSITGGPLSVLLWAMYADTADYGEWVNGRRATGLVFSASTMSQKFGWAIGAFVALQLMAQVGFEPNVEQTNESLNGLILLFSLIPAGIGVLSMIVLAFYPLNDKKVEEMIGELNERRGEDKGVES